MRNIREEGRAKFYTDERVFYNEAQELNRSLSIKIIKEYMRERKGTVRLLEAMGASGLRSIRYYKEIENDQLKIFCNDLSSESIKLIRENMELNKLDTSHITLLNKDCNIAFLENQYDIIDLDPFGSSINFLGNAFKSIRHGGLILATFTDSASYIKNRKVAFSRYGTYINDVPFKKEMGIRALLSAISRVASQNECAIEPVLSVNIDFYARIIFKVIKCRSKARNSIKNNSLIFYSQENCTFKYEPSNVHNIYIGPLWLGKLHMERYLQSIEGGENRRLTVLIDLLRNELDILFYYDMAALAKKYKRPCIAFHNMFSALHNMGYKFSLTHFSLTAFKTDAPVKLIGEIFADYFTERKKFNYENEEIKKNLKNKRGSIAGKNGPLGLPKK